MLVHSFICSVILVSLFLCSVFLFYFNRSIEVSFHRPTFPSFLPSLILPVDRLNLCLSFYLLLHSLFIYVFVSSFSLHSCIPFINYLFIYCVGFVHICLFINEQTFCLTELLFLHSLILLFIYLVVCLLPSFRSIIH